MGRKEGNELVELMVTEVVLVIAWEMVLLVVWVGGAIDGGIGVGGGEIMAHLCLVVMNGDGKEGAAVVMGRVVCCAVFHAPVLYGATFSIMLRRIVMACKGRRNVLWDHVVCRVVVEVVLVVVVVVVVGV